MLNYTSIWYIMFVKSIKTAQIHPTRLKPKPTQIQPEGRVSNHSQKIRFGLKYSQNPPDPTHEDP